MYSMVTIVNNIVLDTRMLLREILNVLTKNPKKIIMWGNGGVNYPFLVVILQ